MFNIISFEESKPVEEDALTILKWRNDSDTLAASFHSDKKEKDSFWIEYTTTYFRDPIFPPLFCLLNGRRFGFFKFSRVTMPLNLLGSSVEVSVNIDPNQRGKGLGFLALTALSDFFKKKEWVDYLVAEIKEFNKPSIKTFEKAGYSFCDSYLKYVKDIDKSFNVVRYIKNLKNAP